MNGNRNVIESYQPINTLTNNILANLIILSLSLEMKTKKKQMSSNLKYPEKIDTDPMRFVTESINFNFQSVNRFRWCLHWSYHRIEHLINWNRVEWMDHDYARKSTLYLLIENKWRERPPAGDLLPHINFTFGMYTVQVVCVAACVYVTFSMCIFRDSYIRHAPSHHEFGNFLSSLALLTVCIRI